MWRAITFPFKLIGKLLFLGIGYLLFTLGIVLLVAVLSSKKPSRFVETEAVVVGVRDYCVVKTWNGRVWITAGSGLCAKIEKQAQLNPARFEGATWSREPFVSLKFRDDAGEARTREARASVLELAAGVKTGDRVAIKVETKKRDWHQWLSDWGEALPILGLMVASLLAAAVMWTSGGGWQVIQRQNRRERNVVQAKVQLAILAVGGLIWLLDWVWRRLEHTRLGKAATRLHHKVNARS